MNYFLKSEYNIDRRPTEKEIYQYKLNLVLKIADSFRL